MKKLKVNTRKKLKPYWTKLERLELNFFRKVEKLEKEMQKDIGIDDLEFYCNGGYCGIGNTSRTIKLIHGHQLEEK